MDDLAEGSVYAELQVGSWPPPVTQTLLRKNDGRVALTVKGKPSGRLRVALERAAFEPIVVHSAHLLLRTPTILKLQVAWRGNEAVVVAAGQVIGSTAEFHPDRVVGPTELERGASPMDPVYHVDPVDHVDNPHMRERRRRQAVLLVSGSVSAGALAEQCLAELVPAARVLADLAAFVRQGRLHHLPGMASAIGLLVRGDDHQPALLQFSAGLLDAPLILHIPPAMPSGDDPASLLAAAFDASAVRGAGHELAIDLDAWLRQETPWLGGSLPVGWLLRQVELALAPRRTTRDGGVLHEDLVRSPVVSEALCRLAECLCELADGLVAGRIDASDESLSVGRAQAVPGAGAQGRQGQRLRETV
jgi:hypothetical protein